MNNPGKLNIPIFRNKSTVAYDADDMEWQADSQCKGKDPEIWFPELGGISGKHQADRAIAICNTCPLSSLQGCARLALDLQSQYGVWAGIYLGTTSSSRAAARKKLHTLAGLPAPKHTRAKPRSVPRPCTGDCGRLIRSSGQKSADYPGTLANIGGWKCRPCYDRANGIIRGAA